jgi:hypothetical protein
MPIQNNPSHIRAALRGRSQAAKREAIALLIQRPDALDFVDDVKAVCLESRTARARQTWLVAKDALFQLDPHAWVEMDRQHPFSELKQWEAEQAHRAVSASLD